MTWVQDTKTKIDVWCGHLSIEQHRYDQSGEIHVRRVQPQGTAEHVQLDVKCKRHGEKRTTQQSFCFHLTPEQVDLLIVALTKTHPRYDHTKGYTPLAQQDAADRAFYGLAAS